MSARHGVRRPRRRWHRAPSRIDRATARRAPRVRESAPLIGPPGKIFRSIVTFSVREGDIHGDVGDACQHHRTRTTVRGPLGGRVRSWRDETTRAGAGGSGGGFELGMTSVVGARPSPYERSVSFTAVLGAAVSLVAWPLLGHAVAVPLVAVGLVSLRAGVSDARTHRISNRVAAAALAAFVATRLEMRWVRVRHASPKQTTPQTAERLPRDRGVDTTSETAALSTAVIDTKRSYGDGRHRRLAGHP